MLFLNDFTLKTSQLFSLFIAGKNIGAILLPLKDVVIDSLTSRMPLKATIIFSAIVVS